jgi:hypothetical protein
LKVIISNDVLGLFFDPNNCPDLNVWNNMEGVSGNVVSSSYWNIEFGVPAPIPPGASNMVPEFDFVFDYNKDATYEFEMGLDMAGLFEIFNGYEASLVKWYIPFTINSGSPAAPDCNTNGIDELMNGGKSIVKIVDFMGRETEFVPNTPLIYIYSDGTTERVYRMEE